ncbi:MFS transporter [Georgenia halophila]|uniref:MFS transporter n=1 Tax=Georgenia halophila TaxID=620889 RepID=A0ABP8LL47_9MICO
MSTTHPQSTTADRRKVVAATIIGTTIEWYDFFIYAFAANLVFAPLFFSPAGEGVAMILSLLTIGLSFLFRPLGAFLAGHYGDRLGRRPMLVLTLLLMGGATTLVGVLPTYASAGLFAPIALILLRILQGISAGGEWGGAVLMSVEHAPLGKRGQFGMSPQLGVPIGMIVASGILALMRVIAPGDAFLEWGWRVPFLLSVVLIGVGYIVRRTVEESPVFQEIREHRDQQSAPIKQLFARHGKLVVLAALLFAGNNALGYMTTGGFIQGLASRPTDEGGYGFDPVGVQLAILLSAVVWLLSTMLGGWLSDKIGRKKTYFIGWALLLAAAIPLFELVKLGVGGIAVGASFMAVGLGLTYGPQAAWYAEMFPARIRYSGVSISYAIGAIIGGAFAASIAQALLQAFGTTWAIVPYLVLMVVIAAVATALLKDRRDIPLDIDFEKSGQWESWHRDQAPHEAGRKS